MHTQPVLNAAGICKIFYDAEHIRVLNYVDLTVDSNEIVAICGKSGSGKSTLLHVLGLLDVFTCGSLKIAGIQTFGLSERKKSSLRNRYFGFVYQFHHLLSEFSALDNIAMPLIIRRVDRKAARQSAHEILASIGLCKRANSLPSHLSGGERQRVALARALVTQPACILADEPTGNLDYQTAQDMLALLEQLNYKLGTAFVIVTHDRKIASRAHRRMLMENGHLVHSP